LKPSYNHSCKVACFRDESQVPSDAQGISLPARGKIAILPAGGRKCPRPRVPHREASLGHGPETFRDAQRPQSHLAASEYPAPLRGTARAHFHLFPRLRTWVLRGLTDRAEDNGKYPWTVHILVLLKLALLPWHPSLLVREPGQAGGWCGLNHDG
jgi:hypothetical protein